MRTELYWISGPWPGRLAIVPRPRGGDWLADEVRSWRDAGLNVVVSLLTPEEIAEFELEQEENWCQVHGLQFHSFPIPDRGVPASRAALGDLVIGLEKALGASKGVAVHCRQGIGRSGLVTATLLVAAGEAPETALACISRARRRPVPDTLEQSDWVKAFTSIPSVLVPGAKGKVGADKALPTNRSFTA